MYFAHLCALRQSPPELLGGLLIGVLSSVFKSGTFPENQMVNIPGERIPGEVS